MADTLQCWRCGAQLNDISMPLRRTETCAQCDADLYVCKMCQWFDPRVAKSCRETVADEVKEKERANFCDYLTLNRQAYRAADTGAADDARRELAELFGDAPPTSENPKDAPSAAEAAKAQLEALFGKKDDTQ